MKAETYEYRDECREKAHPLLEDKISNEDHQEEASEGAPDIVFEGPIILIQICFFNLINVDTGRSSVE